jgi:transposase-like protein
VLLSERQDRAAAEAFFRSARAVTGRVPDRVTTDGHSSYSGAIKTELGEAVTHRTNRYLNNHLEQDHRGIKQRIHSMCGFKRFVAAARFCRVYEEVRHFFRTRSRRNEVVSLAWQRALHVGRM